mmetsp:Transcript_88614/g.228542  ORF Transcript_88614/g.228542 Transcript_88614/m.228542 type:complete len:864 (-) Transcript_88614:82-2673(-)
MQGGYPVDGRGTAVASNSRPREPGPRHPLLEKGTFEQLQRNDIIETRPHILHFGGFQIHKEHSHVLRILNISPSSLRVSIIGPQTQWFKISFDKKGLLAPGMAEDITVTFTPHEWRYYYDTIKIHCGELSENLIVPIHAYPSANDITLPRIVDFGRVAIGTSKSKTIPLSCKIPIQFEYEIVVIEEHPDFTISPLTGVIPADGSTQIVLNFKPSRHGTAHTELQFNIAQFDFEPVTVSVTGSCHPDISRNEVLKGVQSERDVAASMQTRENMIAMVGRLQDKKVRAPLEVRPPVQKVEVLERVVDGVKIPTAGIDTHSTRFVLNQTAGKLPLKDLVSFIKKQREAAETRRRRAEAGRKQGSTDDEASDDDDDKQALELRFDMQYREVDKYDKEKELRSAVAIGEDQMTEEDLHRVEQQRRMRHVKIMHQRMNNDMVRVETVLSHQQVAVPLSYRPQQVPTWDENANETFSVRLQVIDRFVRVGSKCLARVRAAKRCSSLLEAMRNANVTDRASCQAWVESENKAAAAGMVGSKPAGADALSATQAAGAAETEAEKPPVVKINKQDFVLPVQIPTASSGLNVDERVPIEVATLGNFEKFEPVPLNVRLDYKVLRYERMQLPPSAAYMRPHTGETKLSAALEEHSVRGPRGSASDGAEVPLAMPDSCLLPPSHDALSLLIPSTECRTYVGFPDATECDPECRLAQPPPLLGPLDAEPLLPRHLMSVDTPWLATWRRARQIQDPFQYFDPMAPCFAEAGGSFGPRMGTDAGGERLSFLPVGGYAQDLPSDTDDDECDEFKMPPPGKEEFQAACESLKAPLTSELWRKERALEERLSKTCAENNRAVRDRLVEWNSYLSYKNKLYLG